MTEKISAVYKITNTITGDFYVGSSKDVKQRWRAHKKPSVWKNYPNNQMYIDMQKYGVEKFSFQILEEVEPEELKVAEQQFIELLKPTYNNINAKGLDIERRKETKKEYRKSEKGKESRKKANNKYYSQLCCCNGQTITLNALSLRFWRKGIPNPTQEAKKYLKNNNPIEFYDVYP